MARRHGFFFKTYKEYSVYLLDNGLLLFFSLDGKGEDKSLHIQLDETLRLKTDSCRNGKENFTVRVHGKSAVTL